MQTILTRSQALEWIKRHDYPRLPSKGNSYRATTGGFGLDAKCKPWPLQHHTLSKTIDGKFIQTGD